MSEFFAVATWVPFVCVLTVFSWIGVSQCRPALLAFTAISAVQAGVRPLIFFLGLDVPQPQTAINGFDWSMMSLANITVLCWIACFAAFYLFFTPMSKTFGQLLLPRRIGVVGARRILILAIWPTALAVCGTLYLAWSFGGFDEMVYASKLAKDLKGLFVVQESATLAALLSYYGLLVSLRKKPGGRIRPTQFSYVFAIMIVAAEASNYLWGNRYNIALAALVMLAGWHFYVKKLRPVAFAVLGTATMLGLYFLGNLRLALISSAVGADVSWDATFWNNLSNSLHFAEYDALMLAVRDAGHLFDFRAGQDFMNGLLSWIPRFIYESKQTYNIGPWFRQIYEPWTINGWPVTTAGSWYVDFGFVGILFGAAVSAFMVRAFDHAYKDATENPWSASVGLGLCFFMLGGGVGTGFPQRIVLLILPLWACLVFLRINFGKSGGREEVRTLN